MSKGEDFLTFDFRGRNPSRKGSIKKESLDMKPLNTALDIKENSPIASDSASSSTARKPMIHNKLYCAPTGTPKKRTASSKLLERLGLEDFKNVGTHEELAETAQGVRMLAKNLTKATIHLDVKTVMVVTKPGDISLIYITRQVVEYLLTKFQGMTVYVDKKLKRLSEFDYRTLAKLKCGAEDRIKFWDRKFTHMYPEVFDLVVTLGGDGTVLYASNLFQKVVPPVIAFALGSLGFLTNFPFDLFREKMESVIDSGLKAYLRMRFSCRVHRADGSLITKQQVLNELVIDRGPSPYITHLDLFGDDSLLTVSQADGIIIATPTGSTAYSLSAGGALIHPGVNAISVTPICPHTLSFRPILLPDGMTLKVRVSESSRSTAWASFDGKSRIELKKGDYVNILASAYPFPTVIASKTEYIDSVSRNLNWNAREPQRPLATYLTDQYKEKVVSEQKELTAMSPSSGESDSSSKSTQLDKDYWGYDENAISDSDDSVKLRGYLEE